MKETFEAPPFTVFASLESVARNVTSTSLIADTSLGEKILEVERTGVHIRWHQGASALTFPMNGVAALEIVGLEHGGQRFVAIVLAFSSKADSLGYRMVTSHESETRWLHESAARLGRLLGIAVSVLPPACDGCPNTFS
jgi:hypothetical protein